MNIKTVFSSKQSIIVISVVAVISIIIFVIIQSQISDIEVQAIQREIEVKKQTERLLFDLRETLISDVDNESKKSQSLTIIADIRNLLDQEYIYLRD
jgi:hypothetical protein